MRAHRPVSRSDGFTLMEVLVALSILAILLLGLLAGLLTVVQYNLLNHMRDEARVLALECAENIRNTPFQSLVDGQVNCGAGGPVSTDVPCADVGFRIANSQPEEVRRRVRNTYVSYRIGWSVSTVGDVRSVQIQVCWTFRNRSYTHTITTLVSRGGQG